MTNDHWTDRLSDYVDGELDPRERAECEAHLERCPECSATVEELRLIVERAAVLPDDVPARDLWPDIKSRLEPRTATRATASRSRPARVLAFPTRRVSLTIPQLAAAAIALVVLSASSVWLMLPGPAGSGSLAVAPRAGAIPVAMTTQYDDSVRQLQAEFDRRRETLDPETVRVVETNLAIIDTAIREARAALAEDPSSGYLQTHLANAMRQKVELLSHAATIEPTEI